MYLQVLKVFEEHLRQSDAERGVKCSAGISKNPLIKIFVIKSKNFVTREVQIEGMLKILDCSKSLDFQ